jgi:transposase
LSRLPLLRERRGGLLLLGLAALPLVGPTNYVEHVIIISCIWADGCGYSRFCDLLRGFERCLTPVMRQYHVAGEKAFVDSSGKRIGITDPTTGEVHEAEIFVGVLGASNLTYAEATWTQQLPDWTGAHVRMFRFFGGVPKKLVPDNLKSGVNKASFYDPEINRTYGAMAAHYSVGILPARPGKPWDLSLPSRSGFGSQPYGDDAVTRGRSE